MTGCYVFYLICLLSLPIPNQKWKTLKTIDHFNTLLHTLIMFDNIDEDKFIHWIYCLSINSKSIGVFISLFFIHGQVSLKVNTTNGCIGTDKWE